MCISMLPKLSISILAEKAALCSVFLIQVTADFLRHLELKLQSQHGLLPTRSPHHIQSAHFSSVNSSSFAPFPYHSLPAGWLFIPLSPELSPSLLTGLCFHSHQHRAHTYVTGAHFWSSLFSASILKTSALWQIRFEVLKSYIWGLYDLPFRYQIKYSLSYTLCPIKTASLVASRRHVEFFSLHLFV